MSYVEQFRLWIEGDSDLMTEVGVALGRSLRPCLPQAALHGFWFSIGFDIVIVAALANKGVAVMALAHLVLRS